MKITPALRAGRHNRTIRHPVSDYLLQRIREMETGFNLKRAPVSFLTTKDEDASRSFSSNNGERFHSCFPRPSSELRQADSNFSFYTLSQRRPT